MLQVGGASAQVGLFWSGVGFDSSFWYLLFSGFSSLDYSGGRAGGLLMLFLIVFLILMFLF